jgi:hypothetical protein
MAAVGFFISYTGADRRWAEWIAWQLEAAGFTTVLQAWDFRPGSDFVRQMNQAVEQAERTIAVLSPAYLASTFGRQSGGRCSPRTQAATAACSSPSGCRSASHAGCLPVGSTSTLSGLTRSPRGRCLWPASARAIDSAGRHRLPFSPAPWSPLHDRSRHIQDRARRSPTWRPGTRTSPVATSCWSRSPADFRRDPLRSWPLMG